MAEEEMSIKEKAEEKFWRSLARRYWYIVMIFGIILVGAIIGFILTLDWYIKVSAIGGFGSWTFNEFSLGEAILWCLFFVLWLLLFVGLPTLAIGGFFAAITWFVVLPPDVKDAIRAQPKGVAGTKRTGGSGGFNFLLFVGVCLKVWLDGNWFTKFAFLPIGYFIYTWLLVLVWALIIFGIPAAIIGLIWFAMKCEKTA